MKNPFHQWFERELKSDDELTQTILAEELETSKQNVNDWLNNKRLPNPTFLLKIHHRTNIPKDKLLDWAANYDDGL